MADNDDRSTLLGRMGRYGRVGTALSGAAIRYAGSRYLGRELDRKKHAADLKVALGGLKGPLMKAAQILSTIPDALPNEYARELSELQANAPPMGWPFVRRRMAAELGGDWQSKFRRFDKEAARAASLGQVHRAEDHDGNELACKVQYPDMQSAVAADLNQLKLIFAVYKRYDSVIDTAHVHDELSERLIEELDYVHEANATRLYSDMLADETGVRVPRVVDALSSKRLLTTNWLDGTPMAEFAETATQGREDVAINMFRAWYVPLYYYGVIHGDPHMGNYTVNRADGSINLYDFGCIRVFKPSFVRAVIDLYHALMNDDRELAVHAYETWGFADLSNEMIDVLNIWASFLYAPVMEDKVQRIQASDSGQYGAKVAHEVHQELRKLGGVTPPREFVLMDRAAIGLGSVFIRLRAEVNWYQLFQALIADFDEAALASRQAEMLGRHDIPLAE